MNNRVWEEFIGMLYNGFHNTTEVLALIGYREASDGYTTVEYVEYYTSHDESAVLGNFKSIVKNMANYMVIRGEESKFILVHNHPARLAEPSESDISLTHRFQVACGLLGATCMGSYIYIEGQEPVLIGGRWEDNNTERIRIANLFNENRVSMERLGSRQYMSNTNAELDNMATNGVTLGEGVLDEWFNQSEDSKFGLVEVDSTNRVKGAFHLDKLNHSAGSSIQERIYQKGMSVVLLRDSPRFVLYDKRENIERDGRGLADDAKRIIYAMRLCDYPITYYAG